MQLFWLAVVMTFLAPGCKGVVVISNKGYSTPTHKVGIKAMLTNYIDLTDIFKLACWHVICKGYEFVLR